MKRIRFFSHLVGFLYYGPALGVIVDHLGLFTDLRLGLTRSFEILPVLFWFWLGIALARRKTYALVIATLSYPVAFILQLSGIAASPWVLTYLVALYAPLQMVAFALMSSVGRLSSLTSHTLLVFFAAYFVHVALLAAAYSRGRTAAAPKEKPKRKPRWKRKRAQAVAKKRAVPELVFPAEASLYEKNAFRVLGLATTASIRNVTKHANDALALLAVNQPFDYKVVPFSSSLNITSQDVRVASNRLQRARTRIQEEMFWFHVGDDGDDGDGGAYGHVLKGDFAGAREAWNALTNSSRGKPVGGRALRNLAIMEHALAITSMRDSAAHRLDFDSWGQALSLWKKVCAQNNCWEHLTDRAKLLGIPVGSVRHQRREIPKIILGVNLAAAREALARQDKKLARAHLKVVRDSGFDRETVGEAFRHSFQGQLQDLDRHRQQLQASAPDKAALDICDRALACAQRLSWVGEELNCLDSLREELDTVLGAVCSHVREAVTRERGRVQAIDNELREPGNTLIGKLNPIVENLINNRAMVLVMGGQIKSMAGQAVGKLTEAKKGKKRLEEAASNAREVIERGVELLGAARELANEDALGERLSKEHQSARETAEYRRHAARKMVSWADQNIGTLTQLRNAL